MSDTKILQHVAAMNTLRAAGIHAETNAGMRRELAKILGVRIPANQIPLAEREALTLREAAELYRIDYHRLLADANMGVIETYRPKTVRGTRSWRRVRKAEMERYVAEECAVD